MRRHISTCEESNKSALTESCDDDSNSLQGNVVVNIDNAFHDLLSNGMHIFESKSFKNLSECKSFYIMKVNVQQSRQYSHFSSMELEAYTFALSKYYIDMT